MDKDDYDRVIAQSNTLQGPELLMRACKMGAARELFEETGLDYRSTLDRYIYMKQHILSVYIYIFVLVMKNILLFLSHARVFFMNSKSYPTHTHKHNQIYEKRKKEHMNIYS